MITLLISTRNSHKVGEIQAILSPRFRYLTLNDFPAAPPVAEDAPTFAGNATKKAVELARWLRSQALPVLQPGEAFYLLADDSGLEVDALEGAPGVYSARFAALEGASGNARDSDNNAKLQRLLETVPWENRRARFRCVLALVPLSSAAEPGHEELQVQLFEGACEGHIAFTPGGQGGFGYDPLFIPLGYTQSFAELGEAVKNQLSHRSRALAQVRLHLLGE